MPVEEVAHRGRGEPGAAVGTVDVQPEAELLGTPRPPTSRSSTTPKFVVPLVATTAKKVSGPCSSSVRAQLGAGHPQLVVDVDAADLGVHDGRHRDDRRVRVVGRGDAVAGGRRVPAAFALARAVCRATTSADRLPTVPPGTKTPPADSGRPARSAIQRSAWFSA